MNFSFHYSNQREKVAVDTVLIIETPSNHDLKAISHASGEHRELIVAL